MALYKWLESSQNILFVGDRHEFWFKRGAACEYVATIPPLRVEEIVNISDDTSASDYASRNPNYYLAQLAQPIRESLTPEQLEAFHQLLSEAIPKPSAKLVDLRFMIDVIVSRFYVVIFVGKDNRKKQRRYVPRLITRVGNTIAVLVILLGVNLTLSAFILLAVYLLKSAIGFDLLPGHFPNTIKHFLNLST